MSLLRTNKLEAFYGDFQALFGIDFEIDQGEIVAMIGANGAGKSTFLKTVCGLLDARPEAIVFDGEPIGAVLRVPAAAEARGNLHVGGTAVKTEIDERDREIIAKVAPFLRSHGQILVGLDVIGGMLTEVNITSPTGVQHVARLENRNVAAPILDCFERLAKARARG